MINVDEKGQDAPGLIWLCFVNWVNTLEKVQYSFEKKQDKFHPEFPQKQAV